MNISENVFLKIILEKVRLVLLKKEKLYKFLQIFGWKDERPKKTRETVSTHSTFDITDTYTVTHPASAVIPESFIFDYNKWYTGVLALVEANIPSRIDEFIRIHKGDKSFEGSSSIISSGYITPIEQRIPERRIIDLAAIIISIPSYIESHLYDSELSVAQLYMNDELEEAETLLNAHHVRAAGAIAGVVLGRHLKLLCDHHYTEIKYPNNPGVSKLNDLLKDAGSYDQTHCWSKIQ